MRGLRSTAWYLVVKHLQRFSKELFVQALTFLFDKCNITTKFFIYPFPITLINLIPFKKSKQYTAS